MNQFFYNIAAAFFGRPLLYTMTAILLDLLQVSLFWLLQRVRSCCRARRAELGAWGWDNGKVERETCPIRTGSCRIIWKFTVQFWTVRHPLKSTLANQMRVVDVALKISRGCSIMHHIGCDRATFACSISFQVVEYLPHLQGDSSTKEKNSRFQLRRKLMNIWEE